MKIIVLAKQVPDTRNVGKNAMKADGTVNRGALPAIFNPEDLNALEQALRIKDKNPEATITILTMGPGRAAEIIREAIFRGADNGILITDRKFAGSDTLATSYVISLAIKKLEPYDIVIAGRQAIDGDTAQVGPQIAEKLSIPQITYAEEILSIDENEIIVRRRLERGTETVKTKTPCLLTIHSSAPACRARNAKKLLKYKHALTLTERQDAAEDYIELYTRPYLEIKELSAVDLNADSQYLGISGSPTKVKKIENVVFTAKEAKKIDDSKKEIEKLIVELLNNHTIG
ncbi:MAG: electron transfer flavoprotein subunit beta/FixA family protein [Bacteroidetes bacterium]|jgi:electron transfer flavoprotein beta subunit|nr:electron transfer flavoprotein subunit beta/FixA family protein [Bacteroidota bacterium]MBT6685852.1 electron transfer flavoprotein subunit beta/FixA family protein [Bacteroidota bacterium]MBT7142579.1 electron transfer flavoprotein subunit beta/FixA family protein [Bacteroidota bacterium]MBT7492139.1 electron transfer flavoprotein subunit beta/FixA family protein [Bacteroidota bacterium]